MKGCFTALITPFTDTGLDMDGLEKLVAYQIENGIAGILAAGTTGESPTLSWDEQNRMTRRIAELTRNEALCIAGTGSNNTQEAMDATRHAGEAGAQAVLLVDPYYNGPSSLEIRREYIAPIAAANPDLHIVPYVIPGRTGAQLMPEDLAMLAKEYDNVNTVKEATGDLENMRRTRRCCGSEFSILSGDDSLTVTMMTDPAIQASGVISVYSNLLPGAVSTLVKHLCAGDNDSAQKLAEDLAPLFELVTVATTEQTPFGPVACKAKNPLGIKTLMAVLGLPAGPCRRPLGRLTGGGMDRLLTAAREVYTRAPELFAPLERFFGVNVEERLNDPIYREGLFYVTY